MCVCDFCGLRRIKNWSIDGRRLRFAFCTISHFVWRAREYKNQFPPRGRMRRSLRTIRVRTPPPPIHSTAPRVTVIVKNSRRSGGVGKEEKREKEREREKSVIQYGSAVYRARSKVPYGNYRRVIIYTRSVVGTVSTERKIIIIISKINISY